MEEREVGAVSQNANLLLSRPIAAQAQGLISMADPHSFASDKDPRGTRRCLARSSPSSAACPTCGPLSPEESRRSLLVSLLRLSSWLYGYSGFRASSAAESPPRCAGAHRLVSSEAHQIC